MDNIFKNLKNFFNNKAPFNNQNQNNSEDPFYDNSPIPQLKYSNYTLRKDYKAICEVLNNDQLFCTRFDTIPGIFGRANKKNFEKINKIKKRSNKNLILMFESLEQVLKHINLDEKQINAINIFGKFHTSFKILKSRVKDESKENLYSTNDYLVFRIYFPKRWFFPQCKSGFFCNRIFTCTSALLKKFGPLYTTSCNYEGKRPRKLPNRVISFAKENSIHFNYSLYWGNTLSRPSTIIDLEDGKFSVIRKGIYKRKIQENIQHLLASRN
ncbi:Sua5/YciO/YrdC/YwlC family protein [symbiont of Argiope bruennichi]|uniref:Sua5/YciO/YrdC/YwlC family protein n=1 Tax=symbiont of Argiope bruennichi TaxID=2810479 RepID=UPI003DA202E5